MMMGVAFLLDGSDLVVGNQILPLTEYSDIPSCRWRIGLVAFTDSAGVLQMIGA
jgi:hypothetical protein